MQIRRFSADMKTKISGNHPGLYGVPIAMKQGIIPAERLEAFKQKVKGLPFMLDADIQVEAMYFDAHASIEEHSADHPILFLVIGGHGKVRIGGPTGETQDVQIGDTVLWPPHLDHTAWTDEQTLEAIVINL